MAGYKVSYKVLKQQGEDMKAAAKLVDGYSERVAQIVGKLGDDALLAEVRSNLQKLRTQLGESRAILNTAGEMLVKSVDSYSSAETRQVKKVDGTKAHNRDFYKNPVVVASAGGAAGAAAAGAGNVRANTAGAGTAGVSPASASIADVSANAAGADSAVASPADASSANPAASQAAAPAMNETDSPVSSSPPSEPTVLDAQRVPETVRVVSIGQTDAQPEAPTAAPGGAGVAVGAAAVGAVAGAGAVAGGQYLKKRKDAARDEKAREDEYDPEEELKKAIERLHDLEKEGDDEE